MNSFITVEGIVLATVAAFIFGFIWYSPLLFMSLWLTGKGVRKEDVPKRSHFYMGTITLYSFVAHGCIAFVLALVLEIAQPESMYIALSITGLLALGFVISTRFIDMVYVVEGKHYDRQHQINFLVTSGYYVAAMLIMTTTFFLVS